MPSTAKVLSVNLTITQSTACGHFSVLSGDDLNVLPGGSVIWLDVK